MQVPIKMIYPRLLRLAKPLNILPVSSKSNDRNFFPGPIKCCSKFPIRPSGGLIPIRHNKAHFESKLLKRDEEELSTTQLETTSNFDEDKLPFLKAPFRSRCNDIIFLCDWYPQLFGIDEDEIPASEDEEMFEVDVEELNEKAMNLTESEMAELRKHHKNMTDEELREAWIKNNIPKYARRVRAKPILERDDHELFECICDIDFFYCRHHIPKFSEGIKDGEELRVPHFKAFWEEYKEKAETKGDDRWSAIIEKPPKVDKEPEDMAFKSFFNKSYTKTDLNRVKKKLLASFRPLNCREIRRYRMPFAEALYLELQEDGYREVAVFFKYLIIKDYFMHEAPENTNPTLRQSKGKLLKLVAFLKLADRYSKTQEYHKETTVLLRTAKYFNDHDENWWWLAEEFYARAVKVSEKSVIDGGKSEAIARFMLGVYLLGYAARAELAQEHFSKAIELSMGKDWTAEKFLNEKQESLYIESVNYLCRVLIIQSQELRKNGKPNEALPLIHRSYKLCQTSKTNRDIEMETFFELGMTYQDVGFFNWAKIAFRKFIEISKEKNYARRTCDGYLEMAICYRSEGDLDKCHQNLLSYLHLAQGKGDENLIAFGHRYLGEFHLNNASISALFVLYLILAFIKRNAEEATEYFKKAFSSFSDQLIKASNLPFNEWKLEHFMLISDVRLTRCLQGLAQGEVLTKPICQLITSAKDSKNQVEILKLLQWKNRGEINFDLKKDYSEQSVTFLETWGALAYSSKVFMPKPSKSSDLDLDRAIQFAIQNGEKPIIL